MLISIIMPVYNTELYLPACLDSIQQQTYTNWELLAVNDHSTDQSGAILEAYAQKDSRIKPLLTDGKGVVAALRTGYKHSRGSYISRMDSDDIMPLEKLEKLLFRLQVYKGVETNMPPFESCNTFIPNSDQHNGVSGVGEEATGKVATAMVQYFNEEAPLGEGFQKYEAWLNGLMQAGDIYREIYKECVIPSPCWLCHRDDFERAGAFHSNLVPEDYDLCFRFYQAGIEAVTVPEVLHLWRDRSERTTRQDDRYFPKNYNKLRLPYFLAIDRNPQRPLVLWGAGKKGKDLAADLVNRQEPFTWVCNTPGKWGHQVHGVVMQSPDTLHQPVLQRAQIIVSVAAPDGLAEIREFTGALPETETYYFS